MEENMRTAAPWWALLFVAVVGLVMALSAHAQTYPAKPIRLVVPYAPGGTTDLLARLLGRRLTQSLGQPVVVDNKAGAGTLIGAEAVAKAPPDGYTLLMATSTTLAINAALYKKLPYDPVKDFTPVAMVASVPLVLVINPSVPARTLGELVAAVQAKPGGFSFASAGNGSPHHLAGELFRTAAKLDVVHIPYKGSAPAITDLLGGQVQMMFADVAPALPYIRDGTLCALAVTSARRVDVLPQVPTIAESGYPGFEAVAWQSIVAPAATPKEIVQKLHAEIDKAVADPAMKQQLTQQGVLPYSMPLEQMSAYVRSEIAHWGKAVHSTGATAE